MVSTKREDKKRMGIKTGLVWIKRAGGLDCGWYSLAVIDTLKFITMRFGYFFR